MLQEDVLHQHFVGRGTTNVRPYQLSLVKRCGITSTVPSCEEQKDCAITSTIAKKGVKIVLCRVLSLSLYIYIRWRLGPAGCIRTHVYVAAISVIYMVYN